MKSTGSALRSAGRLVGLHRKSCAAVAQPAPVVGIAGFSSGVMEDSGTFVPVMDSKLVRVGGLREEADPKCAFPSLPSVHLQRRGFLSCGDGDEDCGLSKHFEEDRVLGYTPKQVFDVVAAVDLYEDFVPYCQRSQVLWTKGDELDAELEIGFKFFVERYISHVQLKAPHQIKTTVSQSSLFDFLNNDWNFKQGPTPDSCHLHFVVDFQFKSPLYRRVANIFFNEVQARLVGAFEDRCRAVYGPSLITAGSMLALVQRGHIALGGRST